MIKEFVKQIEVLEQHVVGYKVDRRQQIENISTLFISIAIFMLTALYLDYMPVMVSALILSY